MLPDLIALDRAIARKSFAGYARAAWPVLEPATPLKWGWSLDAICEHLEAVSRGEILRLLINVPPGCMKSLLLNVLWPSWEWGPQGRPGLRYLGTAHKQDLAVRDNLKCRRLIMSEWYQDRWPIKLTGDQNAKTKFENEKTGFREAMAFTSLTGSRGDRVLVDDPLSVDDALSIADLKAAELTFTEAVPTRVNNDESAIVVIMQRLHENDTSGIIIKRELGYEHLCLPMRFEEERRCVTSIGFTDPRKEEGELLFPERFSEDSVAKLEKSLGTYATAGQLQQRPAPRGGALFDWETVKIVDVLPKFGPLIRYWDKAGTEAGGAYTAGALLTKGADGVYYVLDVVRGQWGATKREAVIRATADLDGTGVVIWIEQEPGSGGKESAESTVRNLAGYTVKTERPTGDKAVRAEPLAVQVEVGNVRLYKGPWNREFLQEMAAFPFSKYKDQIDAASGAFNKLTVPQLAGVLVPKRLSPRG